MCKSLGPVSFVIDDKISRLLTTRLYGWMDGWAAWSTHFRNRVQLGQSRCMGGLALDLRLSTSFYTFNEDGATLLMRRTGWARTNISHENGWNDIAWFLWLACQVHIHYFHVKRFFVYQFLKSQCWKPTFALCNSTGQVT